MGFEMIEVAEPAMNPVKRDSNVVRPLDPGLLLAAIKAVLPRS